MPVTNRNKMWFLEAQGAHLDTATKSLELIWTAVASGARHRFRHRRTARQCRRRSALPAHSLWWYCQDAPKLKLASAIKIRIPKRGSPAYLGNIGPRLTFTGLPVHSVYGERWRSCVRAQRIQDRRGHEFRDGGMDCRNVGLWDLREHAHAGLSKGLEHLFDFPYYRVRMRGFVLRLFQCASAHTFIGAYRVSGRLLVPPARAFRV
jgi:hypothetical protein